MRIPCSNLEHSGECAGLPSPFTPVLLQYQLALQLSEDPKRETHNPIIAATILQQIEAWVASFPPVYRSSDPDTSWDAEHPYLPFQRKHLHFMSNLFKLSPVKHFLIKDPKEGLTELESDLRVAGVDVCIRVIRAAHELFGLMSSPAARGFIVVCVAFITTTSLISAVMRDAEQTLPHRELILESVHLTLNMTHQLRDVTAAGRVAYNILSGLVKALPLYPDEVALVRFGTCTVLQAESTLPGNNQVPLLTSDHARTESSSSGDFDRREPSDPLPGANSDCVLSRSSKEEDIVVPTEKDFMNADWDILEDIWGSLDNFRYNIGQR